MLVSSVLNSVTFKDLSGDLPKMNNSNRLNNDQPKGGLTIKKYWQKFNNNDVIPLQFTSSSATIPVLKSYIPTLNETINGTLVSSYLGDTNRYYFNFEVTMSATYHDKIVSFIVTQNSDTLTSEPICVSDISEDLERGNLKKILYTNLDLNSSLQGSFVDWTVISNMYFYVESIGFLKPEGSVDILEDQDTKTNIASKLFSGVLFSTDSIHDYLALKLINASVLDFFSINDEQYTTPEIVEPEPVDGNNLFTVTLNLTEAQTEGLNTDDLGLEGIITPSNVIVPKRKDDVTGTGWTVETPEGYMLHSIWIKHDSTSAASTAVVTCGVAISGTDIIDAVQGSLKKSEYVTKWKQYSRHFLNDPDNTSNIYFSVSGAGAVMNIIVNFETVTPES